jgi:hypothetical protein
MPPTTCRSRSGTEPDGRQGPTRIQGLAWPTCARLVIWAPCREHDTRIWRVIEHYVDTERALSSFADVTKVGPDETAAARGQDYVTVFMDPLVAGRGSSARGCQQMVRPWLPTCCLRCSSAICSSCSSPSRAILPAWSRPRLATYAIEATPTTPTTVVPIHPRPEVVMAVAAGVVRRAPEDGAQRRPQGDPSAHGAPRLRGALILKGAIGRVRSTGGLLRWLHAAVVHHGQPPEYLRGYETMYPRNS